jgi:hypothetical protein
VRREGTSGKGDEGEGDEVKEAMIWECKYGADPVVVVFYIFFVTKWGYQFGLFVERVCPRKARKRGWEGIGHLGHSTYFSSPPS